MGGNAGSVVAGNSWNGPVDGGRPQWTVSSGNGGDAGNVNVTLSSNVVASGAPMAIDASGALYSVGIAAQSLGGSGGNVQVGGHDAIDFVGTVGHGGTSGNVQVIVSGALAVGNAQATTGTTVGILAQSLGGGAGVADVYAWKQGNDESTVAAGGTAGNVVVTVNPGATITLAGEGTRQGIIAQSVGAGAATIPGLQVKSAGSVGNGGAVSVANYASIAAGGSAGFGILAQSIGGGGGMVTLDPDATTFAIGNAAGAGSSVSVLQAGNAKVSTTGNDAPGIVAQALGDGGGILATCDPTDATCQPVTATSSMITIGSNDNAGFNAGTVAVALGCGPTQAASASFAGCTPSGASIVTQGDTAFGILAQSVASGGGNGTGSGAFGHVGSDGKKGGNAAEVDVSLAGASSIGTQGDGATAILAQSIGGGGGNGASARAWAAAIGGTGGMAGNGGTVNVMLGSASDNAMSLQTAGDYANGVVAQSIGGGGGNGGYAKTISFIGSAAIGGAGGAGGAGGNVTVANYGTIGTQGAHGNGIIAQSVGGGGGTGGSALSYSANDVFAASVAIGGAGGAGGTAGTVAVTEAGKITTGGDDANGVMAQSIAGGGGAGGASLAHAKVSSLVPDLKNFTIAVSLGGSGGGGGVAGPASVSLTGGASVTTSGLGATGVVVQSIAGGGGNGGDSTAISSIGTPLLGLPTTPEAFINAIISNTISFGLTGSGGNGGSAGSASVDMDAGALGISTQGAGANAIVAQSIGGGGGNGSAGNTSREAKAGVSIITIPWRMGGSVGGNASATSVRYAGTVQTTGSNARGIVAQSIGGGGGLLTGGAIASDGGSNSTVTPSIALGGTGGSSSGNDVVVLPQAGARISTTGGYSDGILAQSIGGGGGAAGNADNSVVVSADAVLGGASAAAGGADTATSNYVMSMHLGTGASGKGGQVTVGDTSGAAGLVVETGGAWSQGILAQSIGGGGGSAGQSVLSGEIGTYTQTIVFGGGGGGTGGNVQVQSVQSIATSGYGSSAIVAQSIGGGGGQIVDGSGSSLTRTLTINAKPSGDGVTGGNAGDASVLLTASQVTTTGAAAYGVLAQSIGNSGGIVGFGDGKGGAPAKMSAWLGGWEGQGNGAQVQVALGAGGSIRTSGNQGHAMVAQSIGGGGGVISGADPFTGDGHLGGSNGAHGSGGTVNVDVSGAVSTQGLAAMGVIAQSIGGGGGLWVGNGTSFAANSAVGGSTAKDSGGAGGAVTVDLASGGSIVTSGAGAWGVLAQSIGGGGGFMGDPTQSNWQGAFSTQSHLGAQGSIVANRSNGNGGAVIASLAAGAKVATTGSNAHGIVAQSVGGSGGIVSLANSSLVGSNNNYSDNGQVSSYDGAGGTVAVTVDGTVSAVGNGAYGVFAQSSGTSRSKVTVDIDGAVYGNAAGVAIANAGSGSQVTVNASGTLAGGCTGASAASCTAGGYALLGMTKESQGLTLVNNGGTVVGSMAGTSATSAAATSSAMAAPGPAVPVTAGLTFINHGSFFAGREISNVAIQDYGITNIGTQAGAVSDIVMSGGSYRYDSGARIVVDADFVQGRSDVIHLVNSSWAPLEGSAEPLKVVLNSAYLMPGTRLTVLTQAGQGAADTRTPLAVLSPSPAFSYALGRSEGAERVAYAIEAKADFTPDAVPLHRNERALAGYLQRVWDTGTGTAEQKTLANLYARLAVTEAARYEPTLSGLIGTMPVIQAAAAPLAAQSFLFNMASCATFQEGGMTLQERACAWNRVVGGESRVDAGDTFGYERKFVSWQGGGQVALGNGWFVGGGIAYDDNRFADLQPDERASGHGLLAGVSLKRETGPWVVSATIAGGNTWVDASRSFSLPGAGGGAPVSYTASTSNRTAFVDAKLRTTYAMALDGAYVRPALDLDVMYTRMGGYQESGADIFSLNVGASSQTLFMATPAVEAGVRRALDGRTTMRAYGMAGFSVLSKDGFSAAAALAGVPGAGTFDITAPIPDAFGKAALGVELFNVNGLEARLQYNADFGARYFAQAATFRLGYSF